MLAKIFGAQVKPRKQRKKMFTRNFKKNLSDAAHMHKLLKTSKTVTEIDRQHAKYIYGYGHEWVKHIPLDLLVAFPKISCRYFASYLRFFFCLKRWYCDVIYCNQNSCAVNYLFSMGLELN